MRVRRSARFEFENALAKIAHQITFACLMLFARADNDHALMRCHFAVLSWIARFARQRFDRVHAQRCGRGLVHRQRNALLRAGSRFHLSG